MPSEKELRILIKELANPVLSGEITTKKEFLEKQKDILDKLKEEYKQNSTIQDAHNMPIAKVYEALKVANKPSESPRYITFRINLP